MLETDDNLMSTSPSSQDQGGIIPDDAMKSSVRRGACKGRLMFWSRGGDNFGDYIGPYIFRKMTGVMPVFARAALADRTNPAYFTCGSIIEKVTKADACIVWGSGRYIWHGRFARPLLATAVRGPLTLESFYRANYPAPDVLGDPGLCVPMFFQPRIEKSHRIGFIPHLSELAYWSAQKLGKDVSLISPSGTVEGVVSSILSAERIVSSSLHGVVLAHAYGVPATWVYPTTRRLVGGGLKFADYFGAVGEPILPSDGGKIAQPGDISAAADDAFVPTKDLAAIAARLLEVCPFGKEHDL